MQRIGQRHFVSNDLRWPLARERKVLLEPGYEELWLLWCQQYLFGRSRVGDIRAQQLPQLGDFAPQTVDVRRGRGVLLLVLV